MQILMLGCTGFVGNELVPHLLDAGHELMIIGRKKNNLFNEYLKSKKLTYYQIDPSHLLSWDQERMINLLEKAEAVINLAGEPIAEKRWTKNHCDLIRNSRIKTTEYLIKAMQKLNQPPRILINGSAIGYYGTHPKSIFTEESPCGQDFLSLLCNDWEEQAFCKPKKTRLVIIRVGIVLGNNGGALGKMMPIFKTGFGGPIGSGQQWMSWIHRTDLCEIIQQALIQKRWKGTINCVAPSSVNMKKFSQILGDCLERPSLLRVPSQILKLFLGDGAKVILEGQNVKPKFLEKNGYKFKYPDLREAIFSVIKTKAQKSK